MDLPRVGFEVAVWYVPLIYMVGATPNEVPADVSGRRVHLEANAELESGRDRDLAGTGDETSTTVRVQFQEQEENAHLLQTPSAHHSRKPALTLRSEEMCCLHHPTCLEFLRKLSLTGEIFFSS